MENSREEQVTESGMSKANTEKNYVQEKVEKVRSNSPTLLDTKLCYEAQFLGFTPMSFSDGMYNALLLYSWELLEQAQIVIKQECQDKLSSEDMNTASQDIIFKLVQSFERAFDKLEMYIISHIFRVPDHVVLPEDEIQQKYPNASQDINVLDMEIKELRHKIRQAKAANANLKQEVEDIAAVQAQLDKTLEYIEGLGKIITPDQCESLNFVCTKAVQLKRLLERIDETSESKYKKPHMDNTLETAWSADTLMNN